LTLLVAVALPATAQAAEGEWMVSGGGALIGRHPGGVGGGAVVGAARGINDWLWLSSSVRVGGVPSGADYALTAGTTWTLDVVDWVPFSELELGLGGTGERPGFAVHGGLGVQRFVDPDWSIAAFAGGRAIVRSDDVLPGWSVEARIVRRFGF
jgi:hypothetical protein